MSDLGSLLPRLLVPPPGPRSRELAGRLARVESRNVTWIGRDFPVFWEEAAGANVRDVDGNVYLDLTGAFGVALVGHAHPAVVAAVREQAGRLMHGMGDVHPPSLKVTLLERLARHMPWERPRGVLASTGSEAVEVALKTALLATGRPGIVAFEGGYHGLTAGALAATGRGYFREPFRDRLFEGVAFAPFPGDPRLGGRTAEECLDAVERVLDRGATGGHAVGAVIVEPVQGRAGVRIPPPGFLAGVEERARAAGALVIADEVFTGMGRIGDVLASPALGLRPDLVCLGKAMAGGMPLSACLGDEAVMDAWPPSTGEALHTSTFLGHPAACAAALAVLDLLEEGSGRDAARLGADLLGRLRASLEGVSGVGEVRGVGLLLGVELVGPGEAGDLGPLEGGGQRVAEAALADGLLVLPAGEAGHVVELAPPATLTEAQVEAAVRLLARAVRSVVG